MHPKDGIEVQCKVDRGLTRTTLKTFTNTNTNQTLLKNCFAKPVAPTLGQNVAVFDTKIGPDSGAEQTQHHQPPQQQQSPQQAHNSATNKVNHCVLILFVFVVVVWVFFIGVPSKEKKKKKKKQRMWSYGKMIAMLCLCACPIYSMYEAHKALTMEQVAPAPTTNAEHFQPTTTKIQHQSTTASSKNESPFNNVKEMLLPGEKSTLLAQVPGMCWMMAVVVVVIHVLYCCTFMTTSSCHYCVLTCITCIVVIIQALLFCSAF